MAKLVIHQREGSYSDRWIELCKSRSIDFKTVDIYKLPNLAELNHYDGFLWHWAHHEPRDLIFATSFLHTLDRMGLKVYPDINTCWHFDDKVAQSIYLEAIDAPVAKADIFFDEVSAMNWIKNASWPKVFKLRRGAGSSQVKLVKNSTEAVALCKKAFGSGFDTVERATSNLSARFHSVNDANSLGKLVRKIPGGIKKLQSRRKMTSREKGYLYFQEFMPGNTHDTRITIIGDKAFAFRRKTRDNDFRASGSGMLDYDQSYIDKRCITAAFDVTKKMKSQSMAFDFVFNPEGDPLIVEMSYAFVSSAIQNCDGYYDKKLEWHQEKNRVEDLVLDNLINSIKKADSK